MHKIKRITIDIDTKNSLILLKCLVVLVSKRYHRFSIKRSPSKKGYHVVAWHKVGHTLEEHLRIREYAGDDPARISFDKNTTRTINVLFDVKTVRIIGGSKNGHKKRRDGNQTRKY